MIGSLRGEVLERELSGTALIEVAGVGYIVNVTERTLAELEPGTQVFLHVHHHVTETNELLFGFLQRDERLTFQSLIKINKVGPSLAMAVLATHTPSSLVDIVAANDAGALSLVPGIGKKTAERLLVDLRGSFSLPSIDSSGSSSNSSPVGEVREALVGLGYGHEEIRDVLRELPSDADSSTLLRDALKTLSKN